MATVTVTVPDVNQVTVWGKVLDVFLQPIAASKILVMIDPTPQAIDNNFLDRTTNTVLTNEEGYFEMILPAKTFVTLTIPDANFTVSGMLPSEGIVEARNIGINP